MLTTQVCTTSLVDLQNCRLYLVVFDKFLNQAVLNSLEICK